MSDLPHEVYLKFFAETDIEIVQDYDAMRPC